MKCRIRINLHSSLKLTIYNVGYNVFILVFVHKSFSTFVSTEYQTIRKFCFIHVGSAFQLFWELRLFPKTADELKDQMLTILTCPPLQHEVHGIDCSGWWVGTNTIRRWSSWSCLEELLECFKQLRLWVVEQGSEGSRTTKENKKQFTRTWKRS